VTKHVIRPQYVSKIPETRNNLPINRVLIKQKQEFVCTSLENTFPDNMDEY